ncbi:MAG: carbohydrate ABC transporter permease [Clostridia bacterium]|nr:carbohydrate ABC transporter permease [Clostridia bacterium]
MKKKQKYIPQIILNILFIVLSSLIILPFLLVVAVSLSNERDILEYGYKLIPMNIDFAAYKYVFDNPTTILNAYKVTAIFSIVSMVLSVLFMAMIAFVLSKRDLKGKSQMSFFLYFTMLFNGGLVPTYILITQYLHLGDNIWVYILPGLISPWYVFMMRTFFTGIPYEITEAAVIDGSSEYRIFLTIILPLSKPVLATVALFTFLAKWNDWNTSMLYINNSKLFSLQYMLQRILKNIELLQMDTSNLNLLKALSEIPSETVRMAMAVVVAGPVLVVFPFFQKYFVKGLTVGSVKG